MNKDDKANGADATPRLKLDRQLEIIANSFAVIALRLAPRRLKEKSDQVPFLDALGLDRKVIAGVLDMTPESVSTTLSQRKAKMSKGKASRGKDKR